jgi:hypothetical protein
MTYAVEMGLGAMIFKFHNDWVRHSKGNRMATHAETGK